MTTSSSKNNHATRVELDGRLGNHLFQIAAGYALCLRNANPLTIDFSHAILLPYKLGALGAAIHIGRKLQIAPLRHPGLRRRFRRTFAEVALGYTPFREDHEYDLSFESLGPKTVLQGFYQNERYFKPYEHHIRALFSDDMGVDASSTPLYEDILTSESVGVHIRRGDYLDAFFSHLLVCDLSYYNQAIGIFRRTSEKFRFFLFSDDPAWCKQQFASREFTFVETEAPPDDPRWMAPYLGLLALREFQDDRWTNIPGIYAAMPFGAGMCVRRSVAQHYVTEVQRDPFRLSNTALFYQRGCRGINIEPNPEQFSSFLKYRSQDINLNVGIGGSESTQTFYCLEDAPLSTFSAAEAAAFQRHGHKLKAELQLQVLPIGKIITDHCNGRFPDFMNLDVEGFETEILSSVDFINDYPKVICIETANYSPTGNGSKRHELMSFLEKKNYFLYADTNLNSIYVHRAFLDVGHRN